MLVSGRVISWGRKTWEGGDSVAPLRFPFQRKNLATKRATAEKPLADILFHEKSDLVYRDPILMAKHHPLFQTIPYITG